MRTAFELKIWHRQDKQSCTFLLLWDNRKKHLNASLPSSKDIEKCYQRWRRWYYRFYQLTSPPHPSNSGRINPGSGDLAHDLMAAEKELVQALQRWLGAVELRAIQQQIRDEVIRLTPAHPKSEKAVLEQSGVDIFLACESDEMARLPWEAWAWALGSEIIRPGSLRIIRTVMDEPGGSWVKPSRLGKPRILTVLGDDPGLPLQEDWKAVRSLAPIATIERFLWQPKDSATKIKENFAAKICENRGWDILFFAGHSHETTVTGGRIAIAPNISLSISEIEEYLTQARENGLQLAIFNSCSGLSIADSLVALGLQVVVMREPIRNDVAQSFLKPLCQELAAHSDIHRALLTASHHLQSAEKFAYPSTYLIPSLFGVSGVEAYRIEPFGWKRQLQQWLPTKQEALLIATAIFLSSVSSIQSDLLDRRLWMQSMYRERTSQTEKNDAPPILLIAIDQESINRADKEIDGFQLHPMDREYLAQLIQQLSGSSIQVIGIDYLLDTQEPREDKLVDSIHQAIVHHNTWFVFATRERDSLRPRDSIADPRWSLHGDAYARYWQVKLPDDETCAQTCPFAYTLALVDTLSENSQLNPPQPNLENKADLQQQIHDFLDTAKNDEPSDISAFLKIVRSPFNLPLIIDYSISPDQIYQLIPAWKFLTYSENPKTFNPKIAIIASGGYVDASDNHPPLPALTYWCNSKYREADIQSDCPKSFTGGELHAYTTHHLLSSYQVARIPDLWMILMASLLGKWATLTLTQQQAHQRQKWLFALSITTGLYGFWGLQAYIWANVLIPLLFPSSVFWIYVVGITQKK
ncbi:CHASE2 domain-containing protein [Adonisia turfae]|uniref:CHASE2 domain-containing protein n=1 Tax=Adonisia turfae CCMR0081 TaxID=2292702 RepID=A0A6M0RTH2_9CYAN|nr:CHASE2 domain-containing protein [Adonisia turfae]NEZ59052.1 CHASE2 domain-containing protein [Adonisia turfae CCMR0081]